jgi:sodium-independent sulfate anion transporter 11
LFQKIKDIKLGPKGGKPNQRQKTIMKALWLISTARNVLVVVICSFIAYNLHTEDEDSPFILTGNAHFMLQFASCYRIYQESK